MLQTLFVALLVAFAIQSLGRRGTPVMGAIAALQRVVFKILAMIMWLAPIGAFGAMAAVVGSAGVDALKSLAVIMLGFYATCFLFVVVVLGDPAQAPVTGISIFSLLRTSAASSCSSCRRRRPRRPCRG